MSYRNNITFFRPNTRSEKHLIIYLAWLKWFLMHIFLSLFVCHIIHSNKVWPMRDRHVMRSHVKNPNSFSWFRFWLISFSSFEIMTRGILSCICICTYTYTCMRVFFLSHFFFDFKLIFFLDLSKIYIEFDISCFI